MKKGILFLVSLIWMLSAIAQSKDYFKAERTAMEPQGSFPAFYNKRARKAAKNINTYLQLAATKTLIDAGADSTTTNWTYKTPVNNQRILSISCQAANGPEKHFLFNAATGSLISLQDVFSVNGLAYIKRQMVRARQQTADLRFPVKPEGQEKCIKSDIQEFLLTSDSLFIYPAHCFNTDSAGNINTAPERVAFSMASVGQYLSEYGQVILGMSKKPKLKKLRSNAVAGLYHGQIDQEEVFLQLDAPFEKSLNGTLYFTRSRQSLPFEGVFKSNRLEIPNKAERLSLSIYPGTISGQRKAGNKVLNNFILNRQ